MRRRRQCILAGHCLGVALAAALVPHDVRAEKKGDCGHPSVSVIYDDPTELESACSALTDIAVYFRRMGFDIAPKVSLRFVDRDAAGPLEQIAAHGYFNAP